jgi:cytochrome c5
MEKIKLSLMTFTGIMILFFTLFLVSESSNGQSDEKSVQVSSIPAPLLKVFEKSCMGCHAKGGNIMAMTHLNFSKWENYTSQKKTAIAADICRMVSKGAMPPKSARQSHPENIPTADEIKSVCQWSESLSKNLKK